MNSGAQLFHHFSNRHDLLKRLKKSCSVGLKVQSDQNFLLRFLIPVLEYSTASYHSDIRTTRISDISFSEHFVDSKVTKQENILFH